MPASKAPRKLPRCPHCKKAIPQGWTECATSLKLKGLPVPGFQTLKPAKKRTVFATWKLPVNPKADREEAAANAVNQLAGECPISWGAEDSQFEGWRLVDGELNIKFFKDAVVVHFEAPFKGRVPKEVWLSPCQLLGHNADTWGLDEGRA